MPYYCTVPRCTSMAGKAKNVSFHQFPRDEELAKLWNDILKRGKPYTKYSKVCSLHFKPDDYTMTSAGKNKGQWRTLRKDAIPSQNLPSDTPPPYTRRQSGAWVPSNIPAIDPQVITESQRTKKKYQKRKKNSVKRCANIEEGSQAQEPKKRRSERLSVIRTHCHTCQHEPKYDNNIKKVQTRKRKQNAMQDNLTALKKLRRANTEEYDSSNLPSQRVVVTLMLPNKEPGGDSFLEPKSAEDLTHRNPLELHDASSLQLEKKSSQELTYLNPVKVNYTSPLQSENTSDERSGPYYEKPVFASPLFKETITETEDDTLLKPKSAENLTHLHPPELHGVSSLQLEKKSTQYLTYLNPVGVNDSSPLQPENTSDERSCPHYEKPVSASPFLKETLTEPEDTSLLEPKSAEDMTHLHPPELHDVSSLYLEKKSTQELTYLNPVNVNDASPLQPENTSDERSCPHYEKPVSALPLLKETITEPENDTFLKAKSAKDMTHLHPPELQDVSSLQLEKKSTQELTYFNPVGVNDASPLQPEITSHGRSCPHYEKPVSASPLFKETLTELEDDSFLKPKNAEDMTHLHPPELNDVTSLQLEKKSTQDLNYLNPVDVNDALPLLSENTSDERSCVYEKPVSASPLFKETITEPEDTSLPESTQDLSGHLVDLEDASPFQSENQRQKINNITSDDEKVDEPATSAKDTSILRQCVLNAIPDGGMIYNLDVIPRDKEVDICVQQIRSEEINYTITNIQIDLEDITNEDNDNLKHYPSEVIGSGLGM